MARASIDDLASGWRTSSIARMSCPAASRRDRRHSDGLPTPAPWPSWRPCSRRPRRKRPRGVYIAFEDKDYRQEGVIQWVNRKHWGKSSRLDYDYHDAQNEQCEWYWGAKAKKRRRSRRLSTLLRQGRRQHRDGERDPTDLRRRGCVRRRGRGRSGHDGVDPRDPGLLPPGPDRKWGTPKPTWSVRTSGFSPTPINSNPRIKPASWATCPCPQMPEGQAVAGNERGILQRIRTSSGELAQDLLDVVQDSRLESRPEHARCDRQRAPAQDRAVLIRDRASCSWP